MPFEKGHKFSEGKGRPPEPPEVKEAKRFNRHELEVSLSKLMVMTPSELQTVKTNSQSTAVELALAAVLIHAINKGDEHKLEFLFNRSVGKLKENIEISNPYMSKSIEELEAIVKAKMLNE